MKRFKIGDIIIYKNSMYYTDVKLINDKEDQSWFSTKDYRHAKDKEIVKTLNRRLDFEVYQNLEEEFYKKLKKLGLSD